jgi:hypothetical protein
MTAPNRRWFQFSLKELLVLTTILAIACWVLAHWTVEMDAAPGQTIDTPIGKVSFQTYVHATFYLPLRQIALRLSIVAAVLIPAWIIGREIVRRLVAARTR